MTVTCVEQADRSGRLLRGNVVERFHGKGEAQALVHPDCVTVYQVQSRRLNTWLFRGEGDTLVPGVAPPVTVLCHARGRIQARRLIDMLRILEAGGRDPDAVPDLFFHRCNALLARRPLVRSVIEKFLDA